MGIDVHTDAELPGVHTGVRAAATLQIRAMAHDLRQRLLEHLLYRAGVVLDLPAVVIGAAVGNGKQNISFQMRKLPFQVNSDHRKAGRKILHSTTPAQHRAAMPKDSTSAPRTCSTFILVRPSPPW